MLGEHETAAPLKRRLSSLFLKHLPGQIKCSEFVAFVLDYQERRLNTRQRKIFDFHMVICPMCRAYFESYLRTIGLGQMAFRNDVDTIPDDVAAELVMSILAGRAAN